MTLAQKQPDGSVGGVAGQVSPKDEIVRLSKSSKEVAKGAVEFSEKEVKLQDGSSAKLQSIRVKEMTLYHGTAIARIKEFIEGEDDTVLGYGVYLTSSEKSAMGYSFEKMQGTFNGKPTIYEARIENMTFLNLSTPEALREFMKFYLERLYYELKILGKPAEWKEDAISILSSVAKKISEALKEDRILLPREMLSSTGSIARRNLTNLGYDGIFSLVLEHNCTNPFTNQAYTTERHDSFFIFDPKKVKVIRETEVTRDMI